MATTYLSPGVYVEEVDIGPKPIQALGASMPAFLGITAQASDFHLDTGSEARSRAAWMIQVRIDVSQTYLGYDIGAFSFANRAGSTPGVTDINVAIGQRILAEEGIVIIKPRTKPQSTTHLLRGK